MTTIRETPEVYAIGGDDLLNAGIATCEELVATPTSELEDRTGLSEDAIKAAKAAADDAANIGFTAGSEATPETDLDLVTLTDDGLDGWELFITQRSRAVWQTPHGSTVEITGPATRVTVDAPIEPDDSDSNITASKNIVTLASGVSEDDAVQTAMEWMTDHPVPESDALTDLPGITPYRAEWLWFQNKIRTPEALAESLHDETTQITFETVADPSQHEDLRSALDKYQ